MIEGLIVTELKKFSNEKGSIYHGIRKSDQGYSGFEEIYFSFIKTDAIKAWKMHKKMTLNLVVPIGEVRFNFIELSDNEVKNRFEITIGKSNYSRITVPPSIIFGFKGISKDINIVTNISNLTHDDEECITFNAESFQFND